MKKTTLLIPFLFLFLLFSCTHEEHLDFQENKTGKEIASNNLLENKTVREIVSNYALENNNQLSFNDLIISNISNLDNIKSNFSYGFRLDSPNDFEIKRFFIYKNNNEIRGYIYKFDFKEVGAKEKYNDLDINNLIFLAIEDRSIKVTFTDINKMNFNDGITLSKNPTYCGMCFQNVALDTDHKCYMDGIIIDYPSDPENPSDLGPLGGGSDMGGDWDYGDGFPGGGGGGGSSSNTPLTKKQIKDINNIAIKDPKVIKAIEDLFKLAISKASNELGRKEMGAWLFYNNKTGQFKLGKHAEGPYVKGIGTNGEIKPPSSRQAANDVESSFLPISFVHTHTPLTYESSSFSRQVGFSEADRTFSKNTATVILIDYIGQYDLDREEYRIKGGHKIDAPTKITIIHTTK